MPLKLLTCESIEKATKTAADALSDLLSSDEPVLFLSSGGSALMILDQVVLPSTVKNCTLTVLDERFAPAEASNYLAFSNMKFFTDAMAVGASSIDPRPLHGEMIGATAGRFERALRSWRAENVTGKIVATVGIGSDGHTSGMLPFRDEFHRVALFEKGLGWVVGYDCGGYNPYSQRITTRHTFMREIDHAVVFVCGDKKPALQRVFAHEGSLAETPGRIVKEMKDVIFVTDVQGIG